MIDGSPTHIVSRTSKSPITNLHLGNARGDLAQIKSSLNPTIWNTALEVCRQTAKAFPSCHYLAVDLMIGIHQKTVTIAEVNAFGDLLPNLYYKGMNTYEAELRNWLDN